MCLFYNTAEPTMSSISIKYEKSGVSLIAHGD